jgi:hypothetical protein
LGTGDHLHGAGNRGAPSEFPGTDDFGTGVDRDNSGTVSHGSHNVKSEASTDQYGHALPTDHDMSITETSHVRGK